MRFWFDTEFIESGPGKPIHLISIGIVAEDGREFYAINSDCPLADANDWVRANVLPHLVTVSLPDPVTPNYRMSLRRMANLIRSFCGDRPQFWAYYADYDWVVFCQMFGTMMDLPKGWPMYCFDIKQWAIQLGDPKLPEQRSTEHNALNDARWNREAWQFLRNYVPVTA